MRVAVIGSGMAGLTAARMCRDGGFGVTIYESAPKRGMDRHAVSINHSAGLGMVDMPLRVMSNNGWRTVLAMCRQYGVDTFEVTTAVSLSWLDQTTWFRSSNLRVGKLNLPMIGAARYFSRSAYKIIRNLWRLAREPEQAFRDKTLEEFFRQGGYDAVFWRGLILPLLQTISTCSLEHLLRYPAEHLLAMVQDIIYGAPLRRIKGGTRALVDQLVKDIDFVSGAKVSAVTQQDNQVLVKNEHGFEDRFDYVIVATQANQLGFLGDAFNEEKSILNRFVFDHGTLYLHRDRRVMPTRESDWTPLAYLMDQDFNSTMFSVWINPVEPTLSGAEPLFQTWNPTVPIDPAKIIAEVPLERAVVSHQTIKAHHDLCQVLQRPDRRVYFCGSWSSPGIPLLESAARSAIFVARQIGVNSSFLKSLHV